MKCKYYEVEHHDLDISPMPKEETPLFINEPWLIDMTLNEIGRDKNPEAEVDNRRVYVPLDLNKQAILRRLGDVIYRYGEASEENEMAFSMDVQQLLWQVEIYDQIWYARHTPVEGTHSTEAVELMKEFIDRLEAIPDACAEIFPFVLVEELKEEYLQKK